MRRFWLNLARAAWLAVSVTAQAQPAAQQEAYPTRPITIVVPYTPGSGADILARAIGPVLSRKLGQPVVVDNRAGASGTIGTAGVARAAPDGYTLLLSADAMTMTPALYRKLSFSPDKDLAPIGRIATGSLVLVANPLVPVKTVADLIGLAKQQPGQLTYASPGNGTPQHVLMELFKQLTGIDMQHIPYKGMGGALSDLIGGQVQFGIMSVQVAAGQIASGRLRLIAVADRERLAAQPNVPTFQELGYADLSHPNWFGLFAPAKTPSSILDRLNANMDEILAQGGVQEGLSKQGLKVAPSSSAALASEVQADLQRWRGVISKAGISAD